ncbi:MAG: DUF4147 domain-containing protein [Candidatus Thermoplasmatota archaeon]|nr:DUF4147 domain-containing protein [Candidatus Thermoplasmatota archaeon]
MNGNGADEQRKKLVQCYLAGLDAVDPRMLVENWLQKNEVKPDFILSVGKAATPMTQGAIEHIGPCKGIMVTSEELVDNCGCSGMVAFGAAHPLPDQRSLNAGNYVQKVISGMDEGRTMLLLLSGGGSAMLATPKPPLTLNSLTRTTQALIQGGASIHELNAVRRHLETLKGGGMARVFKGKIVTLALSDVIGDDLCSIASGPTAPDPSFCEDVLGIIEKYSIELSPNISRLLRTCEWETPKKEEMIWERVQNHILANNRTALLASAKKMEELYGQKPYVLDEPMISAARTEGARFAALVEEKGLVVGGGETVVKVKGPGKGGRNQEMAVAAIARNTRVSLLFASTDGVDGPTDAAGGYADIHAAKRAKELRLDPAEYLGRNDCYNFLQKTGALFKTGHTGTNVCDMALGVSGK